MTESTQHKKELKLSPLDKTLCSCIYDVIINSHDHCMLELDGHQFRPNDLKYLRHLQDQLSIYNDSKYDEYFDYISDLYVRLAILTNEHLNIEGKLYFRVCRIIYQDLILDLNKLRYLINVSVWSDGSSDVDTSSYLIYHKGKLLFTNGCPPTLQDIFEYRQVEESNYDLDDINQKVLTQLY